MDETDNPLLPASKKYPVDRNNIAPRIGFTHQIDAAGKSLVRAGYGIFYNRTLLGAVDDAIEFPKFATSVNALFPNDTVDPGPSRGQFPTDPFLLNGPFVNRALLNQRFPPGTRLRNTGVVIHHDEKGFGKLSETERQQMYGEYRQFTQQIKSSGQYLAGSELHPTSAATSVRVRDGKRLVTDGPFAETREQLGGYYLIEAKDLDEAIGLAARIPSVRVGTVEVRPVMDSEVPRFRGSSVPRFQGTPEPRNPGTPEPRNPGTPEPRKPEAWSRETRSGLSFASSRELTGGLRDQSGLSRVSPVHLGIPGHWLDRTPRGVR